jgi:hypothetical protein
LNKFLPHPLWNSSNSFFLFFIHSGPGGSSIRATSTKSGADIRSWNDSLTFNGRARRVRTIVIEVGRILFQNFSILPPLQFY